uniref:C2H2-type domain-containing protein n=1 Tax=Panagrellus redivivus TaxID=6233 RepID=A0A7E4VKB4_PANRE
MFAKTGGKNDHPGWHHFNTTGNGVNTSVVCVYCSKLFHDSEVGQLLKHLETVHERVDVTWMRFVVEKSTPSGAVGVKTAALSSCHNSAGIDRIVDVEGTIREVKREPTLPVSNFTEIGCSSNITETYEPIEFDDSQPSSSDAVPQRAPSPMSSWLTDQVQSRTPVPSVPQTLEELESQSLDRSYRIVDRFTDIEAFDECRLKLNLVHRQVGRLVVKTLYECQSAKEGCPFVATSLHTASRHGLYVKNEHHSQNCQIEGEKQYQKYLSEPRFLTLLELEVDELFDIWKPLGYYRSTEDMEKAIEEANMAVKTSNFWHFRWHRIYYKCRNSSSCKYQVLTVSNFKEIGMYCRGTHTCQSGFKKTAVKSTVSKSESASLDKVVANLADKTLSWTAIGHFTNLNDLHAAQDKQVVARDKGGNGQAVLSYYRCRRSNFGCSYQQLIVSGTGVFGLYEHGQHEHEKVNVKTRGDLKRSQSESVEPEAVSDIVEDGYDESEDLKTAAPPPPVWTLLDRFRDLDELNETKEQFPLIFPRAHPQNKLKRRRMFYACAKKKTTGCTYRMSTLAAPYLYELSECGEHNHEAEDPATIIAPVKQRHDALGKVFEEPPPKKEKVVKTPKPRPKPVEKLPKTPPKKYPEMDEAISATGPPWKFLQSLPDRNELTNWYQSHSLMVSSATHLGTVSREYYRCVHYPTFGCGYIVQALTDDTRILLYESGKHQHPFEKRSDDENGPNSIKLPSGGTAKRVFCMRF